MNTSAPAVVGSGMLAQACTIGLGCTLDQVCVFASGVSNSKETAAAPFERERELLLHTLATMNDRTLVYFGTCSVADSELKTSPYVLHKLAMEQLVCGAHRYVIFRLPQVVGHTDNPSTLTNFLFNAITRGEEPTIWTRATRNLIDVDHVAAALRVAIESSLRINQITNVAAPMSHAIPQILAAFEEVLGLRARYRAVDRGGSYDIDVSAARPLFDQAGIAFDNEYLHRLITKYYGTARHRP